MSQPDDINDERRPGHPVIAPQGTFWQSMNSVTVLHEPLLTIVDVQGIKDVLGTDGKPRQKSESVLKVFLHRGSP